MPAGAGELGGCESFERLQGCLTFGREGTQQNIEISVLIAMANDSCVLVVGDDGGVVGSSCG
jgi:hypothetical protein